MKVNGKMIWNTAVEFNIKRTKYVMENGKTVKNAGIVALFM
jgi:hypothetical protein